jgi:hypothetical protein
MGERVALRDRENPSFSGSNRSTGFGGSAPNAPGSPRARHFVPARGVRSPACAAQRLSVLGLCLAVATLAAPPPASACGGCFVPPNPTGTPTAVNAHRMVIAVAPGQTILWDQIVYEGDPGDFVWVLPVAPGTRVELSDNAFFEALTERRRSRCARPRRRGTLLQRSHAARVAPFGFGRCGRSPSLPSSVACAWSTRASSGPTRRRRSRPRIPTRSSHG